MPVGRHRPRYVAYVPPLALLVVILVVPVALLVANALAVGPARGADSAGETLWTE